MTKKKFNDANQSAHSHDHDHAGCNHDHDHDHHSHAEPIRRDTAKIGRNDVCACGSGKKFKKCCRAK